MALHLGQHFRPAAMSLIQKLAFVASRAHRLRLNPLFLHRPKTGRWMNTATGTRCEVVSDHGLRIQLSSAHVIHPGGRGQLGEERRGPDHAATAAIHRLVLKQSRFAFEKQAAVLVIEHHIIVHLLAGLRAVVEGRI